MIKKFIKEKRPLFIDFVKPILPLSRTEKRAEDRKAFNDPQSLRGKQLRKEAHERAMEPLFNEMHLYLFSRQAPIRRRSSLKPRGRDIVKIYVLISLVASIAVLIKVAIVNEYNGTYSQDKLIEPIGFLPWVNIFYGIAEISRMIVRLAKPDTKKDNLLEISSDNIERD
jgi:hypothetical protein